ncbi:hypothetical protein H1164_17450 [Thermoactinomyces daqus]|uniref:Uncharacterized protein n=1 Tax=Thermoactinomyces daqus TaxID=1329516 RepID=A0A7W1XDI0_9BACL|nr:hypothetical protein [Thermoactinomyces daqus]MBA4544616.1 hypothetical protein [Thermoactinomyces daqus]
MGKLDKYARASKEKRTERVQTKLTPTEYRLFMKYLRDRGLSQAEGVRFLILEEIGLGIPDHLFGDFGETAASAERVIIEPESTLKESTSGVQKDSKKESNGKPQYSQWRVDGKMPCPICQTWQKNIAAHLKGAHKTTKQAVFSEGKYQKIASEMVKSRSL